MTAKDTITLPREVVQEALEALAKTPCNSVYEQDCTPCNAEEALRKALAAEQPKREFDHGIGTDRFKVVRGTFWWHVKIGDSPTEHGKFRSSEAAQKMANDLLREFRNGAFVQNALAAEPTKPSDDRKAMKEALRILTKPESGDLRWQVSDACDILRTAIRTHLAAEQPKPEPVAWQCREHGDDEWFDCSKEAYGINPSRYVYRCLYTAPPDAPTVKESLTHPGYVIGSHWLETAYSRICAGEAEEEVLRDCGWERVDQALRRDAERYRWLRDWERGTHDIVPMTGRYSDTPILSEKLDAAIDAAMGEKR